MVIPAAIGFDFVFRKAVGRPFLDPDTAHYVIHSLNPIETLTIFYAALTGVLLWASSIGAGWLENWAVYRRLPDAIAHHRWRRVFGVRFMGWLSKYFERNISGFGGNTTLGVLLGFVPVLGKMTGLPIDVRHITLSTGALALAVSALAFPVVVEGAIETEHAGAPVDLWNGVAWAGGGIAVIGLLNFGVSFVLALSVALRARNVTLKDGAKLGFGVVHQFVRSPIQFFFPPKGEPERADGHAH
jgi:site-specific recombinase